MGHLLSRAFRRLTQCSSHPAQQQQQQQQHQEPARSLEPASVEQQAPTQDKQLDDRQPELIPVGRPIVPAPQPQKEAVNEDENEKENEKKENEGDGGNGNENEEAANKENSKQDVEGAVIKIQALVRGHLTRKALKDAHQHQSLPAPNALGQSQFDEESLTREPPSAIFTTASPLAMGAGFQQQQQQQQPKRAAANTNGNNKTTSSLEPIDETQATTTTTPADQPNDERRRLGKLCTRSATSPAVAHLETPPVGVSADGREQSTSPVPSEAAASIDLTHSACLRRDSAGGLSLEAPESCPQTPASVSIDILDHNIKPADKLASVLHAPEPSGTNNNNNSSGDNNASERCRQWVASGEPQQEGEAARVVEGGGGGTQVEEEAAAIRIQSAFRGYRTRKNSPYRTRSPTSNSATRRQQQQASEGLEEVEQEEVEELRAVGAGEERRSSRPRQRDCDDLLLAQQPRDDKGEANPADWSPALATDGSSSCTTASTLGPRLTGAEVSLDSTTTTAAQVSSVEELLEPLDYIAQPPLGAAADKSEATDSSSATATATAAAATDLSAAQIGPLGGRPQQQQQSGAIDEDKSLGADVSDEPRLSLDDTDQGGALVEEGDAAAAAAVAANEEEDERELDQLLKAVAEEVGALDEEEQRAIELESDDIERRDPLGQASEERAKSPQIRAEEVAIVAAAGADSRPQVGDTSGHLAVGGQDPMDEAGSGRSSPNLHSATDSSSEGGDNGSDEEKSKQQQQQDGGKPVRTISRNKRRNQRNKKKGKK